MKIIEQSFEVMTPSNEYNQFTYRTEEIGRVCYKSEDKMAEMSDYIFVEKLIKNGHHAMLEHCNLTVKFITDRAVANEIVRHRHCAFAQESTHYINYVKKGLTFVTQAETQATRLFVDLCEAIEKVYGLFNNEKTKVRRSLLPLCFKTELIVTTNIREWRHILKIRTTEQAHPQMRELMRSLLDWCHEELNIFFKDINYES